VNEPRTHGSLIRGGKRGFCIGVHCLLDHSTNKCRQRTDRGRSHCASFKQRSRFGEVPFPSDIFPSNSVPVRRKAQRGTGGNSERRQRVRARKLSPAPISDLHRLAIHSTRTLLCGSFLFTSRSIRRSHGQASCGPKVKILSRSKQFGYTDCEHTGD
jgi:hypothetical protein